VIAAVGCANESGVSDGTSGDAPGFSYDSHHLSKWCRREGVRCDIAMTQPMVLHKLRDASAGAQLHAGSHVVLFYTGHGKEGTGAWVFERGPTDVSAPSIVPADVFACWAACVQHADSRLLVAADCCYAGCWASALRDARLRVGNAAVLAACLDTEQALHRGAGGLFTVNWLQRNGYVVRDDDGAPVQIDALPLGSQHPTLRSLFAVGTPPELPIDSKELRLNALGITASTKGPQKALSLLWCPWNEAKSFCHLPGHSPSPIISAAALGAVVGRSRAQDEVKVKVPLSAGPPLSSMSAAAARASETLNDSGHLLAASSLAGSVVGPLSKRRPASEDGL
jgi:hypothetical protein